MPRPTPYTPEEKQWLRRHYATTQRADILAHYPGRTWVNIQALAHHLHMPTRQVPGRFPYKWTAAMQAYLRMHYPVSGSKLVTAYTGLSAHAVRAAAARLGVSYQPAKVPPKAYVPRPRPPAPVSAPGPLLAVRRSAKTPNLNVSKEARRRAEEAPRKAAGITADQIRQLDYNHPGRVAYTLNGAAGWQQWKAAQLNLTL